MGPVPHSFRLFFFALVLLMEAGSALADARQQLADDYTSAAQDNNQIYQSAPITHVVPAFNTITYALGLDYRNVTISPSEEEKNQIGSLSEQLKLTGYTASPYLAISLRRIGLGFSAETGARKAAFSSGSSDSEGAAAGVPEISQESDMDFKSIGAFLYLIPFPSWHKLVTATVILGGRNYNVKHQVSDFAYSSQSSANGSTGDKKKFIYNVVRYESGLNVSFRLLKSFAIIPWADYTVTDAHSGRALANQDSESGGVSPSIRSNLNSDIDMFWYDEPRLKYGVDFSVRIARFEIHLGDAFGSIAAFKKKSDQIADKSFSLSLSLDQKAN